MAAGSAAAAAAAAKRRQEQEEEEQMSKYSDAELNEGWEFKIVRSHMNAFGNPATLQRLIQEEAQAGWVMLEKFDNARVRFRRPLSAREGDAARLGSGADPYRTVYGISEGALVVVVLAAIFGSIFLIVGMMALFVFGR